MNANSFNMNYCSHCPHCQEIIARREEEMARYQRQQEDARKQKEEERKKLENDRKEGIIYGCDYDCYSEEEIMCIKNKSFLDQMLHHEVFRPNQQPNDMLQRLWQERCDTIRERIHNLEAGIDCEDMQDISDCCNNSFEGLLNELK